MTFLDANILLRALVRPVTPQDQRWARQATTLLLDIRDGKEDATTSEAVLAEVVFIPGSPRRYNMSPADIVARLKPIIGLPGLKVPRKRLWLRALDVFVSSPNLGFVDALTIAYAEQPGITLATFDHDVDGVPGISRWQPPAEIGDNGTS